MLRGVSLLRGDGIAVVRSHHERWDGRGYPDGLAGDEIPLAARLFAVADALDAMTTDRPYRRAMQWEAASAEIVGQAGSQFDPRVVEAFEATEPELRRISRSARRGLIRRARRPGGAARGRAAPRVRPRTRRRRGRTRR